MKYRKGHYLALALTFILISIYPTSVYSLDSYSLQSVGTFTPDIAVSLENGSAGESEISVNKTRANVTLTSGISYDFVDSNISDVDSSGDKGTHSNFTAQQSGPDSTFDNLTEGVENEVPWYEINWNRRKKITVDYTKVEADLNDFPILIDITDTDLRDYAQTDGDDILFTASNGTTKLSHEIEMFNGTTGQLITWVKANISATINTELYVYYDNPSASNQENIPDVWSNGYVAVWHLHDVFTDSTSNNWDGTNYGSGDNMGKIADAQDFYPTDGVDYIDIGSFNVNGDNLTIQAWIKSDDNFAQNDARVLSKAVGTAAEQHVWMMSLYDGDNGENRLRFRLKTGTSDVTGTTTLFATSPNGYLPDANEWYLVAMTYDGENMNIIRDGLDAGSTSKSGNLRVNSWAINIGNNPGNTGTGLGSWDGKIDEVRISSVARSQAWLKTEYNNQYNASNFYSSGIQEEKQYEVDLEVQWTNVDYSTTNGDLCIYGGTMGSENILVDVWNGSEWDNLFIDLTSGWNNVTVTTYLTSSIFTIRFKGGTETSDTNQNSWNIDATLLQVGSGGGTYDYILNVTSQKAYNQTIRLFVDNYSNIDRLTNCTIWFRDGTTSVQIRIVDGVVTQDFGSWYLLSASESRYIVVYAEESTSGESTISLRLEIIGSNSIIYICLIQLTVN